MNRKTGNYKGEMNDTLSKVLKHVKWKRKKGLKMQAARYGVRNWRVEPPSDQFSGQFIPVGSSTLPRLLRNLNHGLYRLTSPPYTINLTENSHVMCIIRKKCRDKNVNVTKKKINRKKGKEVHPDPYTSSRKKHRLQNSAKNVPHNALLSHNAQPKRRL
ncbi:hypothetical protein BDV35DRAFT_283529 [Aspergillus flavus]|uniref:Uncharacterized protein n=1 Tax=Aspergillus flavus TaxID=5059 RepID=A0A5N6GRV7_ASPFL|nr:hypothetical protein BDV35DRAFT_283529 [Aspergillus flavus]